MDNKRLGQVKNLIMLALADGKASESELALIASVASREELTQDELNNLIEHPESVHIELPDNEEQKLRYIEDMVALMMIDGDLDDKELAMCKLYAIELGYESTIVEKMILDIADRLRGGASHDILILPDIHGRTFWKEAVAREEFGTVIFLGDYVDPYPREGISNETALANFREVIDYAQAHDNVVMLLGNHDMHYYSRVFRGQAMSSRYWLEKAPELTELFTQHQALFRLAWERTLNGHRYLFTHSGVNEAWLNANRDLLGTVDADHLNRLLDSDEGILALAQVSWMRGGPDKGGSIVWGDVYELLNNSPLPDVYQIFGHSQQRNVPLINDRVACLDVRRPFVLRQGQPGIEPVEYALD